MSGPRSFWYTFCVCPSIHPSSLASESTAVVSRQVVEIPLADLAVVFDYAIAVSKSS